MTFTTVLFAILVQENKETSKGHPELWTFPTWVKRKEELARGDQHFVFKGSFMSEKVFLSNYCVSFKITFPILSKLYWFCEQTFWLKAFILE